MAKAKKRPPSNTVRIIGGEYRGRRLAFPDITGLRPSTDRVRETVFNWLQQTIPGANCLDLFCGSGALGFESLSRGAKSVWFVDREKSVGEQIKKNIVVLGAENADIFCGTAAQFLTTVRGPVDIVFLDPPFQQDLLQDTCAQLEVSGILAARAWIYLEAEFPLENVILPDTWALTRSKKAGAVYYGLVERSVG